MEVSGKLHVSTALPQRKSPRPSIEYGAGWTPEAVWILSSRWRSFIPAGKLGCQAGSL